MNIYHINSYLRYVNYHYHEFFIYCFSIDKTMHSLGYRYGYALPKPKIMNPLNVVMVYAQEVCYNLTRSWVRDQPLPHLRKACKR